MNTAQIIFIFTALPLLFSASNFFIERTIRSFFEALAFWLFCYALIGIIAVPLILLGD